MKMSYPEAAKHYYQEAMKRVINTLPPINQKFRMGDFVISLFVHKPGHVGRVQYTYAHAYGGENVSEYSLLIRDENGKWAPVAWFDEKSLIKIQYKDLEDKFNNEIMLQNNMDMFE
jgi:hypothetical protein